MRSTTRARTSALSSTLRPDDRRVDESSLVPRQKDVVKPQGRFLAIGPRYPGVLSDDGLVALFTHPGDAQWTEVVSVEHLEEAPEAPKPRRRGK